MSQTSSNVGSDLVEGLDFITALVNFPLFLEDFSGSFENLSSLQGSWGKQFTEKLAFRAKSIHDSLDLRTSPPSTKANIQKTKRFDSQTPKYPFDPGLRPVQMGISGHLILQSFGNSYMNCHVNHAPKLCCPLGSVDEWRRVSQNRTSLLDALFCLEPYRNTMSSTNVSRSHDHPLTLLLRRHCVLDVIDANKRKAKFCARLAKA